MGYVGAFVETLLEEEPACSQRVLVEAWNGRDLAESRARLAGADVVLAYGADDTLSAIRAQLRPQARFFGFGHRTSIGYLMRQGLEDERRAYEHAHAAARDALLYDGDGCRSLHALFVEGGGAIAPPEVARLVARACDALAVEFPAAYAEAPPGVGAYRASGLFRAAMGRGAVYAGRTGPHLVVYDPPRDEPPPLLARTLAVYPVDTPQEALDYVRRHHLPLEAFARIPTARHDVEAAALAAGASALVPLGRLQAPPLGGEHGGVARILPFVRPVYRE